VFRRGKATLGSPPDPGEGLREQQDTLRDLLFECLLLLISRSIEHVPECPHNM
jgi:hypothetical protein